MDRNSLCGSRRDWPMLDRAIKKKIAELCAFVEWWQKTVSPARGGDRAHQSNAAKRPQLRRRRGGWFNLRTDLRGC
ncbi:MAG: hypothetical protein DMG17_15535 [Acidobacteria bacterium]|nr:MAG: hypothetical protein AUI45_14955 [Acidobacteria bacterium 13_1_40CM_2_56_11]PYS15120.1 MAG: hypothetical protein DMG17_15535 [Acidobacteriota bacterium]